MASNSGKKITGGLVWSFGERITAQLVTAVVGIVLARILDPEHYGIIAIVNIFITLCNVFVTSGMGSAVVQKKEASSVDYSTALYISLGISVILYALLFVAAPWIAAFYEMPELGLVIRVMGLRLPLTGVNSIQQAHVQRNMEFKRFFWATLFGTVVSAFVGLYLAYKGFGVWALVMQYLTNTTIDTIVLFAVDKWYPTLQFSLRSAREIFSFGWKVLVTNLIYTIENDLRSLIIGKVFTSADLAYFDQGRKYPYLLMNNLNIAINKVMLPVFAQRQENLASLKSALRRSVGIGFFVTAPIMVGFSMVAPSFVSIVLTDKWLFCVPYIQLACMAYLTRTFESACHQALLGIGKSAAVLKVMIVINVADILLVLVAAFGFNSVVAIAGGAVVTAMISFTCFMLQVRKYLAYQCREVIHDLLPTVGLCLAMMLSVYVVGLFIHQAVVLLFVQALVGAIVYLVTAELTQNESYLYIKHMLMSKVRK